mgnify:CR=1 FL=1|jgi:pilus assembly protein CpaB
MSELKRKRFAAALLALLLAIAGAGSMWWYAQGADDRAMQGLEAVDVFVANGDIPAGTSLGNALAAQLLTIQQIPRRLAPTGASVEVDANNSSNVALNNIRSGEMVLLTRFGAAEQVSAGLAIPNGHVAVTVRLEDPNRVADFIKVGSKVAIFYTFATAAGSTDPAPQKAAGKATRLLLKDILVLGVGAATGQTDQAAQVPSALMTLSVTQSEAERLILSTQTGTIYFALMNDQSDVTESGGVAETNIFR